jgi:hypothetical protein
MVDKARATSESAVESEGEEDAEEFSRCIVLTTHVFGPSFLVTGSRRGSAGTQDLYGEATPAFLLDAHLDLADPPPLEFDPLRDDFLLQVVVLFHGVSS